MVRRFDCLSVKLMSCQDCYLLCQMPFAREVPVLLLSFQVQIPDRSPGGQTKNAASLAKVLIIQHPAST